jgi:hypothetical protein
MGDPRTGQFGDRTCSAILDFVEPAGVMVAHPASRLFDSARAISREGESTQDLLKPVRRWCGGQSAFGWSNLG